MCFNINCSLALFFTLQCCVLCQDVKVHPSRYEISLSVGNTLKSTIYVKGIPRGVTDTILYYGADIIISMNVDGDTATISTQREIKHEDDFKNYYVRLMKTNYSCDMQPVIVIKKLKEIGIMMPMSNCESVCNVTVEIDFNYKCKPERVEEIERGLREDNMISISNSLKVIPVSEPRILGNHMHSDSNLTLQDADYENIITETLEAKYNNGQKDDKIIKYKIGNLLRVTCKADTINRRNNLTWIIYGLPMLNGTYVSNAEIYNLEIIPGCTPNCADCTLEMKLELFDNNSNIICMNDGVKVSKKLKLQMFDDPFRLSKTSTEEIKYYSENDDILFECLHRKYHAITTATTNGERRTYDMISYRTNLNESQNGLRMACVNYSATENPVFKLTRQIYNYKLFSYDEKIEVESKSWPLIAASTIGIVLVVVLVVIVVIKCKKRPSQLSHVVDTYACINRVEYADLELMQLHSRRVIQKEDRSPYAQVIGVLTPKNS